MTATSCFLLRGSWTHNHCMLPIASFTTTTLLLYICIYFLGFLFHSKLNSKGGNNNRFLSPLGAAPSIALVGLGLFELGFPGVICFRFDKNLFRNWKCVFSRIHHLICICIKLHHHAYSIDHLLLIFLVNSGSKVYRNWYIGINSTCHHLFGMGSFVFKLGFSIWLYLFLVSISHVLKNIRSYFLCISIYAIWSCWSFLCLSVIQSYFRLLSSGRLLTF